MLSNLFVLEFKTVKASKEGTVSHCGLFFVVYRVSLQNSLNLEDIKIKTSPLTPRGVHDPYLGMHANLVTPYGMIGGSEYNIEDIGEC